MIAIAEASLQESSQPKAPPLAEIAAVSAPDFVHDQRLKIEVGPFGHHAVEYFAAVLLPGAVKTGKEVQRVSSVSVPRRRRF
jgi:hypothetical protein